MANITSAALQDVDMQNGLFIGQNESLKPAPTGTCRHITRGHRQLHVLTCGHVIKTREPEVCGLTCRGITKELAAQLDIKTGNHFLCRECQQANPCLRFDLGKHRRSMPAAFDLFVDLASASIKIKAKPTRGPPRVNRQARVVGLGVSFKKLSSTMSQLSIDPRDSQTDTVVAPRAKLALDRSAMLVNNRGSRDRAGHISHNAIGPLLEMTRAKQSTRARKAAQRKGANPELRNPTRALYDAGVKLQGFGLGAGESSPTADAIPLAVIREGIHARTLKADMEESSGTRFTTIPGLNLLDQSNGASLTPPVKESEDSKRDEIVTRADVTDDNEDDFDDVDDNGEAVNSVAPVCNENMVAGSGVKEDGVEYGDDGENLSAFQKWFGRWLR